MNMSYCRFQNTVSEKGTVMSRRARTRRDKRQPIPDFDEPTSPA